MDEFKNSINGFPIDTELKMLIANTVINKMESIGFEPTENTVTWFAVRWLRRFCSGIQWAIWFRVDYKIR